MTTSLENEMVCKRTFISLILLTFLSLGIIFLSAGCDSILPDEYKEKEITDVPAIDQRALSMLVDSSHYSYNLRALSTVVDSATRANYTDNQILFAHYSTVADSLIRLKRDTLMTVFFPPQQSMVYAVINIPAGETRDTYLYAKGGMNVGLEFVKRDTSLVGYSGALPLGTIASGLKAGSGGVEYLLAQRCVVNLSEGTYFVRFMMSSPMVTTETIKVVVLSN
jgi:hypothetical protein